MDQVEIEIPQNFLGSFIKKKEMKLTLEETLKLLMVKELD